MAALEARLAEEQRLREAAEVALAAEQKIVAALREGLELARKDSLAMKGLRQTLSLQKTRIDTLEGTVRDLKAGKATLQQQIKALERELRDMKAAQGGQSDELETRLKAANDLAQVRYYK